MLCLIFIDNKTIEYEYVNIDYFEDEDIKIAHLSDLHFPDVMVDTKDMLDKLKSENIDIIAITGDLIDDDADIGKCGVYEFIDKLIKIAPIFYCLGNHELRHDYKELNDFKAKLAVLGVNILENESVDINIRSKTVTIIGLKDNENYSDSFLNGNINNYKIMLAHRPEKWNSYINSSNQNSPNLILTGHAHGGQIRVFNQGLVAPGQGLFPKYDDGIFTHLTNETTISMIISRGIGSSLMPCRFNNKPHIPIISL